MLNRIPSYEKIRIFGGDFRIIPIFAKKRFCFNDIIFDTMNTFRSIDELVKMFEREKVLLKEMFYKRKQLSFVMIMPLN